MGPSVAPLLLFQIRHSLDALSPEIKHRDYVEFEIGAEGPLMVPYWSDVNNEIWFYRKGGLKFRNFLYDHIISSPFVPVQLLTKQAVFHNALWNTACFVSS